MDSYQPAEELNGMKEERNTAICIVESSILADGFNV